MNRINKIIGSQLLIVQTCSAMLFLSGGEHVFGHIIDEIYIYTTIESYCFLSLAVYSLYHVSGMIFQYEKLNNVKKTK